MTVGESAVGSRHLGRRSQSALDLVHGSEHRSSDRIRACSPHLHLRPRASAVRAASAAAALRAAGIDVRCADLSRERLVQESVAAAALIGFFLPMHTATRLAVPVIDRVRALNPTASLVAYGLYAPLNATLLRELASPMILGAEFEDELAPSRAAANPSPPVRSTYRTARVLARCVPRVDFRVPDRTALPPLPRYAKLQVGDDRTDCRLHRGEPRLQAPLPPLPDRARLRRALPRRARRRSSWQTSEARSPRAPDTSRSAIRTSSTASVTPLRSPARSARSFRRSRTTSRSRSSTCSHHADTLPHSARHGLRVRHERGRVDRR